MTSFDDLSLKIQLIWATLIYEQFQVSCSAELKMKKVSSFMLS